MDIRILTVGGTIDKIYFDKKRQYEVGPPTIKRILKELNVNFTYSVKSLFKKDSLDMTERDRQVIIDTVKSDPHTRFIITHGTDTMIETGKQLKAVSGKVIVLTGALAPAIFKISDAIFNIGCAVAAVQIMEPGVYIAMSGRIFDPDKAVKNDAAMRFEAI